MKKELDSDDLDDVSGGIMMEVGGIAADSLDVSDPRFIACRGSSPSTRIVVEPGALKSVKANPRSLFIKDGQWRIDIKGGRDINTNLTSINIEKGKWRITQNWKNGY